MVECVKVKRVVCLDIFYRYIYFIMDDGSWQKPIKRLFWEKWKLLLKENNWYFCEKIKSRILNKVTKSFVSQSSQYNSQILFAGDEISRVQPHGGGAERHDPERGHQQELELERKVHTKVRDHRDGPL